jgi:hypothetical protein
LSVTSHQDTNHQGASGGEDNDDEQEEEEDDEADLENQYYLAKQLREDDEPAALRAFARIVELETPKGDWGFKALKQSMKVLYKQVSFLFSFSIFL